jgi:NADP-dependent 3-hydroxy acid dehydrogenase YdfG
VADKPVAVVTGASRGIGRAIALRLSRTHRIVAIARNAELLGILAEEIGASGGECRALVLDLADPAAIETALRNVDADVLVNNAGVITRKPLLGLTPDEWREMMDVNVSALFHATRSLLPGMVERRRGHIVNIASIAGRSAFPGGTGYVATKHAVLGFSESLMLEVREFGVKVSVVMPGSVATDMIVGDSTDQSWMLRPEDVAEVVAQILVMPSHALTYQVEVRASNPRKG